MSLIDRDLDAELSGQTVAQLVDAMLRLHDFTRQLPPGLDEVDRMPFQRRLNALRSQLGKAR